MDKDASQEQVAKALERWNKGCPLTFPEKLQQIENKIYFLQTALERIHDVEESLTSIENRIQRPNRYLEYSLIREGDFYVVERHHLYMKLNQLLSFDLEEEKQKL